MTGVQVEQANDGQADLVTVNGTQTTDQITATNAPGGLAVSGLAAAVTVTGADAAQDLLTLSGLAGDDVIDASAVSAGVIKTAINGGLGIDLIRGTQGDDAVTGGDGNDYVYLGGGRRRLQLVRRRRQRHRRRPGGRGQHAAQRHLDRGEHLRDGCGRPRPGHPRHRHRQHDARRRRAPRAGGRGRRPTTSPSATCPAPT